MREKDKKVYDLFLLTYYFMNLCCGVSVQNINNNKTPIPVHYLRKMHDISVFF